MTDSINFAEVIDALMQRIEAALNERGLPEPLLAYLLSDARIDAEDLSRDGSNLDFEITDKPGGALGFKLFKVGEAESSEAQAPESAETSEAQAPESAETSEAQVSEEDAESFGDFLRTLAQGMQAERRREEEREALRRAAKEAEEQEERDFERSQERHPDRLAYARYAELLEKVGLQGVALKALVEAMPKLVGREGDHALSRAIEALVSLGK